MRDGPEAMSAGSPTAVGISLVEDNSRKKEKESLFLPLFFQLLSHVHDTAHADVGARTRADTSNVFDGR